MGVRFYRIDGGATVLIILAGCIDLNQASVNRAKAIMKFSFAQRAPQGKILGKDHILNY
jgi:hypothetical protein